MAWQGRSIAARLVRRPILIASARIDLSDARVGMKKRTLRSNQETDEGKRCAALANSLTKKAPYEERLERIEQAPCDGAHVMVRLLARVMGVGIETADMLVHEVLSRNMRDRRAVARYAGLTGSPDESGRKRREQGLAPSGHARLHRGMIQLAWRFLP